jgi:hypothetical protein
MNDEMEMKGGSGTKCKSQYSEKMLNKITIKGVSFASILSNFRINQIAHTETDHRSQKHTWNSKALFFPAQIYCCTIVYIFNILCGLTVKVSRRSLVSIVHINS